MKRRVNLIPSALLPELLVAATLATTPANAFEDRPKFDERLCFCWVSNPHDTTIGRIELVPGSNHTWLRVTEIVAAEARSVGELLDLGFAPVPTDSEVLVYDQSLSGPSFCVLDLSANSLVSTNCTSFEFDGYSYPDECTRPVTIEQVKNFFGSLGREDTTVECLAAAERHLNARAPAPSDEGCGSARTGAWVLIAGPLLIRLRRRGS